MFGVVGVPDKILPVSDMPVGILPDNTLYVYGALPPVVEKVTLSGINTPVSAIDTGLNDSPVKLCPQKSYGMTTGWPATLLTRARTLGSPILSCASAGTPISGLTETPGIFPPS